ncbi:MAG: PilZ domain-containing protein [Myxococcales bacterium]|nr:PilZ domain-containing protein [Myxococcales bacterium]
MNRLFVPIEEVLLETVFEHGEAARYALLQPGGQVSPLRVRFEELQRRLSNRFSHELSAETVVERIADMTDEQLLVTIDLDRPAGERWNVSLRRRHAYEQQLGPRPSAPGSTDARKSPRRPPPQKTDVKLDFGHGSIDGTIYNVSEHGLGMALLTSDLEHLDQLSIDLDVEVHGNGQRLPARIRSRYPAGGGCVLGLELRQRLRLPGLPDIEA